MDDVLEVRAVFFLFYISKAFDKVWHKGHYLVVGDFNSHSQSWGYDHIDKRGEEVENWQDDHRLNLINKPEDQPTFYSRRWRTTSTPDLPFCTDDIDGQINRAVRKSLGDSDHPPVFLTMSTYISCESTLPRWN